MTKSTITREQAQKIIVAADEVITALAGTNEDVHPDDSKKMCELWDDMNDRHAPPVVVRELARMALAAMDSESGCLPLDYLQGHKDGLEWAAQLAEANHPQTGDWLYDDPIELARAIRKGPDMPTAQDGNSPVTPDGWIPVSERMPNDKDFVWCWGYVSGWTESDGFEAYYDATRNKWWTIDDETVRKVTHWMPLPAAPQEVK